MARAVWEALEGLMVAAVEVQRPEAVVALVGMRSGTAAGAVEVEGGSIWVGAVTAAKKVVLEVVVMEVKEGRPAPRKGIAGSGVRAEYLITSLLVAEGGTALGRTGTRE